MKNFLFDVDGTLTPHRQPMTDEFKHFFMKMLRDKGEDEKVFLVTGSDKEKTIERWCQQYYRLPPNVQKRLVIENCEKCFSIKDCLKIVIKVNIIK